MESGKDDPRSDPDLLRAVAEGDQIALRVLRDRHAAWLTFWLLHRSAGAGVVDEVLQRTFMAVWEKADRWRGDGEVAAWIRRIAMHKLLDELRPRSKVRKALQLVGDMSEVPGRAEPSAEEELLGRQGIAFGELGDALRKLEPGLLAVVRCCWIDELTTIEASRALGVPQGTVKTRLMRARIRLRQELGCNLERSWHE